MRAIRSRHTQRGFSLVELLVVVAVLGILAAVAAPGVRAAFQTKSIGDVVNATETAIKDASARAAASGTSESFVPSSIAKPVSVVVNPAGITPPTGTTVGTPIVFQGGTGTPYVAKARVRAAVVVATSDLGDAYAIVVATRGRRQVYRRVGTTWEILR